jgi:hypothetical protein
MTHVGTKGDRMPHHCGNQGLAIGSTLVYRSAVFPGGIIKIKSVKFPLAKCVEIWYYSIR